MNNNKSDGQRPNTSRQKSGAQLRRSGHGLRNSQNRSQNSIPSASFSRQNSVQLGISSDQGTARHIQPSEYPSNADLQLNSSVQSDTRNEQGSSNSLQSNGNDLRRNLSVRSEHSDDDEEGPVAVQPPEVLTPRDLQHKLSVQSGTRNEETLSKSIELSTRINSISELQKKPTTQPETRNEGVPLKSIERISSISELRQKPAIQPETRNEGVPSTFIEPSTRINSISELQKPTTQPETRNEGVPSKSIELSTRIPSNSELRQNHTTQPETRNEGAPSTFIEPSTRIPSNSELRQNLPTQPETIIEAERSSNSIQPPIVSQRSLAQFETSTEKQSSNTFRSPNNLPSKQPSQNSPPKHIGPPKDISPPKHISPPQHIIHPQHISPPQRNSSVLYEMSNEEIRTNSTGFSEERPTVDPRRRSSVQLEVSSDQQGPSNSYKSHKFVASSDSRRKPTLQPEHQITHRNTRVGPLDDIPEPLSYNSMEALQPITPTSQDSHRLPLKNAYIKIGVGIVVVAILLVIILVPLGYHEIEYYEMGLYRNKVTGFVDTKTTYFTGRHWLGVNRNFVVYPADLQREVCSNISIFTTEKLEVNITFSFTYQLRHEDLGVLYETFGKSYKPQLRSAALSALKGSAIRYSTDDFRLNRKLVAKALSDAVSTAIGGQCCRKDCYVNTCKQDCKIYWSCALKDFGYFSVLRYFQLQRVDIPVGQSERFLKQVLEKELEEKELYQQDEQLVRLETEQLAFEYKHRANEIMVNATANSTVYKLKAIAESEQIIEDHRNRGLTIIYEALNVTDEEDKKTLDYVMTLKNQNKASLYLDFQYVVARP